MLLCAQAWKIADLGYQTVLDIVTAEDPAWRMEQLLHNFPSQANSLSNLKVVPEAKQVLSDLHISGIANTLPFNSILVNGVSMDLSAATFGVYDLLDNIKDEYKRQAALNGLGLSSRAMTVLRDAAVKVSSKLASGRPASQSQGMPPDLSSIVRVDVSKGGKNVVQFMNNLEKDSMYANGGFSRSVRTLLQPSWQLHMIAKNLYTLVAVVDLTTPNGRGLLSTLRSIHQRQYPIRIGLVFAPSQNDEAPLVNRNEDMPVTATDILRLFEIAKSSADLPTALELIYELSGQLQEAFLSSFEDSGEYILSLDGTYTKNPAFYGLSRHQLTRGDIVQMAANFLRWTEDELFDALTGPPSTDSDLVGETRSYLQQRGLPIDSFSFNGIVIESSGVEEQLMSLLGREQYFLSQMVQKGLVSDKTRSIFNAVLKSGKMYSRYHPILNEEQPVFVSPLDSPLILLAQSAVYLRNRAVPPQDRTSIVAVTASDTVAVLFSLTQTGLQSAAAAIEWLLSDNSTESTHGVRLALEPLLSDAPTELEIAVVSTLNILVEAVGILDETAALQCVSMFLQAIDATSAGSMTTAVAAFLARRSELLMSVELDMTLDSFAARVANTVPQTDAILARQKFLRAVIKSIEIIPSESYGSDERQQAGARTCSSDTKACNKGVFVLHSGRVLKLKDDYPLHALDLQMLGELVTESVSDIVRDALDKVVIQDIMPAGDGEALLNAVDTLFLSMSAYCGSNAASGPARVDVKGISHFSCFLVRMLSLFSYF